MNSEELELSLRTEFENYLKSFRAEMREQAAEFYNKIDAEAQKHRSELEEAFQAYAARFDTEHAFDEGFKASVVEHLRQSRDEGAALTASAMDEAKQMETAAVAPADFSAIRDAINDISQHRSQAAILKSLVEHAANFAPRGAFFIIKNEQLVGWQVFGADSSADGAIRDIQFPVSADSILGSALSSQTVSDGAYGKHENDIAFLEPLHFGQPDRMHAIPLTARGRGVAVLYADYGTGGVNVNVEALEAIVRIAGLTVEMLASSQTAKAEAHSEASQPAVEAQPEVQEAAPVESHEVETPAEVHEPSPVEVHEVEEHATDFAFTESVPVEAIQEVESPFSEPVSAVEVSEVQAEEVTAFEPIVEATEADHEGGEVIFDAGESLGAELHETSPFDSAVDFEPATVGVGSGKKGKKGKENAVEISPANVGRVHTRSERNVDLPIEVSDEERRPHNDARRFARLLVSEIKLYNEQQVTEGRQTGNIYQRLRDAIDRSREMYDKRVQPPVAEKFDYFHYELVNSLADGNVDHLGDGYPGASV